MKILNDTFIISKRGWLIAVVLGVLFLFFSVTGLHLFQFLFGAVLIGVLIIFRNPERTIERSEPNFVCSPCDGLVLSVEDKMIDTIPMKKIVILSSLWDVSLLRSPSDCVVDGVKIRHGASLSLFHPLSESLNEKCVISFRTHRGDEIFIEHMSEKNCFALDVDLQKEQALSAGVRYGIMTKGRTTIYLPQNTKIIAEIGQSVRAGESIVGYLA